MDENEAEGTKLFSKPGRDINACKVAEASQEIPHSCALPAAALALANLEHAAWRNTGSYGKTLTLSA